MRTVHRSSSSASTASTKARTANSTGRTSTAEFNEFASRQLDEADTLGFGRATYEHMAAYWPTEQAMVNDPAITSRMNDKEKLVFSTTLTDANCQGPPLCAARRLSTYQR